MMDSIWERLWAGSMTIATLLLALPFFRDYLPGLLDNQILVLASKLWKAILYPYAEITFAEYTGERLRRSEIYAAIEAYLGEICPDRAACLKAAPRDDGATVVLSLDNQEEVAVQHDGVTFWWSCNRIKPLSMSIYIETSPEERRFYRLTFHRRHLRYRDSYIEFVIQKGKDNQIMRRQRKLYTNPKADPSRYDSHTSLWSHVPFKHPATFKTLAMDDKKKRNIMEDLVRFSQGKDYYSSIGKPWKRGYLLHGPPGTGKSTMIAAMANFLKYDVYDLELTTVKDNTTLRKLLIETKSKSIIMIEDIDCSLNLWATRKKQATSYSNSDKEKDITAAMKGEGDWEESKVTLSGLLNFIDGLWSSCDGGERIIVLTTNHLEKLDPALLRRGRMDKRVEMSYCTFEGFKTLAKNYLGIKEHSSFTRIKVLLDDNNITPADVTESLMPKPQNSPLFDGIRSRLEEGEMSLGDEPEISLMPKSGSEIKDEELINNILDSLIATIERSKPSVFDVHPICSDLGSSCAAGLPRCLDEWPGRQPTRSDQQFWSNPSKDSFSGSALSKFPWQQQSSLLNSKRLVNRAINHKPITRNMRLV